MATGWQKLSYKCQNLTTTTRLLTASIDLWGSSQLCIVKDNFSYPAEDFTTHVKLVCSRLCKRILQYLCQDTFAFLSWFKSRTMGQLSMLFDLCYYCNMAAAAHRRCKCCHRRRRRRHRHTTRPGLQLDGARRAAASSDWIIHTTKTHN